MTTNLTTMTPAEIDRAWVPLMEQRAEAGRMIGAAREAILKIDAGARGYMPYLRQDYVERMERATATRDECRVAEEPFVAEWQRRGGWDRFYLVTNGNGHVHRETNCATCYPTTQFQWLVDLAGATEQAMVAEFGEVACTVCFPTAPSLYAEMKARGEMTGRERRTQADRDATRREKEERAAAKAAKAITSPDGTPLRIGRYGRRTEVINTLVTAQRELTDAMIEAERYAEKRDAGTHQRAAELYAEYAGNVEVLLAAIAHKVGRDAEELRVEFAAKATKKRRKEGY